MAICSRVFKNYQQSKFYLQSNVYCPFGLFLSTQAAPSGFGTITALPFSVLYSAIIISYTSQSCVISSFNIYIIKKISRVASLPILNTGVSGCEFNNSRVGKIYFLITQLENATRR